MYNMYNGKQGEQLLKVGGHSASLDSTHKMQRAMIFGWPQSHTTKTHYWNNLDKYEPQQQSRHGTVTYK